MTKVKALEMELCVITFIITILASICHTSCEVTSAEVESIKQLYNQSTYNYITNIRPRLNQSHAVSVYVNFVPTALIAFDATEQKLILMARFVIQWSDEFLPWNPKDYFGHTDIYVTAEKIWHPHFGYQEAVEGNGGIGDEEKDTLVVSFNGDVVWIPMGTLSITCGVSVKYYPFDKQTCRIFISETKLNNKQLTMEIPSEIQIDKVRPNAEWALLSVSIFKESIGYSDRVCIDINLQRRHSLTMYTLIAPLTIMSVLNVCLFLLPISSGEKSSVAITLFLSYGVLMVATRDMMPANSMEISLLVQFVFVLLMLSGFTVIYSIIETKIYSSYGQCRIRLPTALRVMRRKPKMKVVPLEGDAKGQIPEMDDGTPEPEEPTESVSDLLTFVDNFVFVIGFLGGLVYGVILFVTLVDN